MYEHCTVLFLFPRWRKEREKDSVGSVTREGQYFFFFYSAPHISSFGGFIEDHLVRCIMGRSTADSFDFFLTFTQTNQPVNLQSLTSAQTVKIAPRTPQKEFLLFICLFFRQSIQWDREVRDHLPRKCWRC